MKNNPNTKYVLIGLVVLIWGLIIYKIIAGLSGEDTVAPTASFKPPAKINADTAYRLLNNAYPDPFSNENIFEEIEEDTVLSAGAVNPAALAGVPAYTPPPVAPQPPAIKYNGYIYNPATKKKTALITYNGRSMVVSVADMLDEKTKVLKIDNQELVVTVKGERFVIGVGG
ncbi:hypothetical protein [Niabella hibiscisoli]|uniref:hypothetical protein n=1 Tax=Niabella hibiscisoli TaxID=1825928 RepID=UPI001F0FC8EA|nr:hypothetical protein [Niabella hibiscisoli]MCH5718225.1 hypothetical protein [Niabella hibiscisoli]